MKKLALIFSITIITLHAVSQQTLAVEDPLQVNNNFIGIHVLAPDEIEQAAKLVNANGGEWGYVLVPLRTDDLDLVKWQKFMDEARDNKVIPIIRIATEPNYKDTGTWRIPSAYDAVDLANFLNSLNWPTKNRYIIVYNEINRFDEWGGTAPDPQRYADILDTTINEFKDRSENFYIIMGGLDNAAPNDARHMNNFTFLREIANYKPEVFNKIDAFSSHSYPNPGFAQPPSTRRMSVGTYQHEYAFINSHTTENKPVFITETGWDANAVTEEKIAEYMEYTLKNIWEQDKDKIVAITPFLLNSHGGFDQFSFIKGSAPTKYYDVLKNYEKQKGEPVLSAYSSTNDVGGVQTSQKKVSNFEYKEHKTFSYDIFPEVIKEYGRKFLGFYN